MINLIIAIGILAIGFIELNQLKTFSDKEKQMIYQWWHTPWAALLYTGLVYLIYHLLQIPDFFLFNLISEDYQVAGIYSLICMVIWMPLRVFLRKPSTHKSLIGLYRKLFANNLEDIEKDKALPFPYFISDDVIMARVGLVFYRWTLKLFVIIIAIVYALFFILVQYANIDFYLISSFGIIGLLPIIEYYVYLGSEVPTEKKTEAIEEAQVSSLDELWDIYVDFFDNYSVAWKKKNDDIDIKKKKTNNDAWISILKKHISENHTNAILEECDLVTAFTKLVDLINQIEENGLHVLIALDIPPHFTKNQDKTYTDEIAEKLSEISKKRFTVYDEKSTKEDLRESVIVAPFSVIVRQGLEYEWMSKIGLIIHINIFDKGVSNLYEIRRFCYILQSVNKDYQTLFITPHRRNVEASTKNTWLTRSQMKEIPQEHFSQGEQCYFIGYNYEEYAVRYRRILTAWPTEPLYSGSEMSPIALSKRIGDLRKAVTPVHYLELAYTNAIEGPEEFGKFSHLLQSSTFEINPEDIDQNIKSHTLPVDQIIEKQIFSILFDQGNNAPAVYSKWMHLGSSENFSIVISKPYLFRDYFNTNHNHFITAPFAALEPQLCNSRITLAIILLNMLKDAEDGVEEEVLRKLLLVYYEEKEITSVPTIIKELFCEYFSSDLANLLKTSDNVDFDGEKYLHRTIYWLERFDQVDLSFLDIVQIEDESHNPLFSIINDLMYQNYYKEQIHSFSGKPYKIKDYDNKTKTLKVRATNSNDLEIIFYKPCQSVYLSGKRKSIKDISKSEKKWNHPISNIELSISREAFETEVQVETNEIYSFNTYQIGSPHSSDYCPPKRTYKNGKVLKISFNFLSKPEYYERINDIRMGLQILIYEAMQSIFPYHAQYLIIASEGEIDHDLPWIFNIFKDNTITEKDEEKKNIRDDKYSHALTYYFIEDANIDLGLIGALSNIENIKYIFQYFYDYLFWLTEDNSSVPEGYKEYRLRQNYDHTTFLKYGRSSLPKYFDIDLLLNFIRDFFEDKNNTLQQRVYERQNRLDMMGTCDFCGKKMKNSEMQQLCDGRMRCPECSKDAIDTDEQFLELCKKAEEAFLEHLGIDFSKIPYKANLVSAVELHKLRGRSFSITNGYDVRKLIGLARSRNDEIFVENGYKPDETFGTIAHELTHIWEFNNPDFQKVIKTNEDLFEGLAVWTDLFLSEKNGSSDIETNRNSWLARKDEYGRGLRFIMDNCPDDPYGYIREKAKEIN